MHTKKRSVSSYNTNFVYLRTQSKDSTRLSSTPSPSLYDQNLSSPLCKEDHYRHHLNIWCTKDYNMQIIFECRDMNKRTTEENARKTFERAQKTEQEFVEYFTGMLAICKSWQFYATLNFVCIQVVWHLPLNLFSHRVGRHSRGDSWPSKTSHRWSRRSKYMGSFQGKDIEITAVISPPKISHLPVSYIIPK